jgi:hypothetical protein
MKSYYEMIKSAEKNGRFTKETMWYSVERVSEMLSEIKDTNPKLYWRFIREEFGRLHDYQYDETFARWDVGDMKWHDKEGKEHNGEYWSLSQIQEATKTMQFPSNVTDWTKYVAFNIFATDLSSTLTDEQILKSAYEFFFKDEDFVGAKDGWSPNKTWCYMEMVHTK